MVLCYVSFLLMCRVQFKFRLIVYISCKQLKSYIFGILLILHIVNIAYIAYIDYITHSTYIAYITYIADCPKYLRPQSYLGTSDGYKGRLEGVLRVSGGCTSGVQRVVWGVCVCLGVSLGHRVSGGYIEVF